MRFPNTVGLALSAVAAAVFAFVPLFGFLYYGAAVQLLDKLGETMGWRWLDLQLPYGVIIAWALFTLIFFVGYKLWLKFPPRSPEVQDT